MSADDRRLQYYLRFLGQDPGRMNGRRGKQTDLALSKILETYPGLFAPSQSSKDILDVLEPVLDTRRLQNPDLVRETRTLIHESKYDPAKRRPLQQNLIALGFDTGGTDGSVGFKTRDAIDQFSVIYADEIEKQKQEERAATVKAVNEILTATEGLPTLEQLRELKPKLKELGYQATDRSIYSELGRYALTEKPDYFAAIRDRQKNTSVSQVTERQQQLQFLGIDPGPLDGRDGPKTKAAQKAFEGIHGHEKALDKTAIRNLQHDLTRLGYYKDKANGELDNATQKAVEQFAKANPHFQLDKTIDSRHAAAANFEAEKKGEAVTGRTFLFPVQGEDVRVSDGIGMRRHPLLGIRKMHEGTDMAPRGGRPIVDGQWYGTDDHSPDNVGLNFKVAAATDMTVEYINRNAGHIRFRISGSEKLEHMHMSEIRDDLKEGNAVKTGDIIGRVGNRGLSTGPHLHTEYRVNGKPRPLHFAYLDENGQPIRVNANQVVNQRFDYSKSDIAMEMMTSKQVGQRQNYKPESMVAESRPTVPPSPPPLFPPLEILESFVHGLTNISHEPKPEEPSAPQRQAGMPSPTSRQRS